MLISGKPFSRSVALEDQGFSHVFVIYETPAAGFSDFETFQVAYNLTFFPCLCFSIFGQYAAPTSVLVFKCASLLN